jgi:hypothetical protein
MNRVENAKVTWFDKPQGLLQNSIEDEQGYGQIEKLRAHSRFQAA